jgi:hypothetical protein
MQSRNLFNTPRKKTDSNKKFDFLKREARFKTFDPLRCNFTWNCIADSGHSGSLTLDWPTRKTERERKNVLLQQQMFFDKAIQQSNQTGAFLSTVSYPFQWLLFCLCAVPSRKIYSLRSPTIIKWYCACCNNPSFRRFDVINQAFLTQHSNNSKLTFNP